MFTALDEDTRHTVLEAAVNEIVLMLEHNIGVKFKLTPAMQHLEHRKYVGLGGYQSEHNECSMMHRRLCALVMCTRIFAQCSTYSVIGRAVLFIVDSRRAGPWS